MLYVHIFLKVDKQMPHSQTLGIQSPKLDYLVRFCIMHVMHAQLVAALCVFA